MKVLITGGAGFIGSHIAEQLQGRAEIRVLDNFRTGHRRNLAGLEVQLIEGSILDRDTVRAAVADVDYVFHLAALVSVAESVANPAECARLNVTGLLNVLEESAAAGVKKLCFSSSAAVYGDSELGPKVETMPPGPGSPYAVTKLEGEGHCRRFAEEGRLATVALRLFNVFGPRQDPGSAYAAAVPIFIHQALAGEPLSIFGDGAQTRDFIHVQDVAAAALFTATRPDLTGAFNVGYGGQITVLELARRIIALAGSPSAVRHRPARAGEVRHSRADIGKLRAAGFRPGGSLESGLAETVAFMRSASRPRD